MNRFRQFAFKQFGYFDFNKDLTEQLDGQDYSNFIKIVLVKAKGKVTIDFKQYQLKQDALMRSILSSSPFCAYKHTPDWSKIADNRNRDLSMGWDLGHKLSKNLHKFDTQVPKIRPQYFL